MQKEVHLEILHFEKYLPRTDILKISWVRFEIDFLTHPDFFELSGDELKIWIYFVCVAAKMKSKNIRMNVNHTAHHLRVKEKVIFDSISKLNSKCLKLLDEHTSVRISHRSVQVEERRGEKIREEEKREEKNIICVEPQASQRKPTIFSISVENDFDQLPKEAIRGWIELYSIEYLERESVKILVWNHANPKKNKRSTRGWIQFISNWLERGWDQHLKNIPTNKSKGF